MRKANAGKLFAWLLISCFLCSGFIAPEASARKRRTTWVWDDANDGIFGTDGMAVATSPTKTGLIYAAVGDEFYRSVDSGKSWARTFRFRTRYRGLRSRSSSSAVVSRREKSKLIEEKYEDLVARYGEERARELKQDLERDAEEEIESRLRRRKALARVSSRRNRRRVFRIVIAPTKPSTLLAATDGGAFLSHDHGLKFKLMYKGLKAGQGDVRGAAFSPRTEKLLLLATTSGAVRSDDGGKTWSIPKGLPRNSPLYDVAFAPADPKVVLAVGERGIYVSKDAGKKFKRVLSLPGRESIATTISFREAPKKVVFVGTSKGLYRSTDLGSHFRRRTAGGIGSGRIVRVLIAPGSRHKVFLATTAGVFVSDNGGRDFAELRAGLPGAEVRDLATDPSHKKILWLAGGMGIYRYSRRVAGVATAAQLRRFRRRLSREPNPYQLSRAVARYAMLSRKRLIGMIKRSGARGFMPRIDVKSGLYLDSHATFVRFGQKVQTGLKEGRLFVLQGVVVWDLARLVFPSMRQTMERQSQKMLKSRRKLVIKAIRLYHTRRRLQLRLFTSPPKTLKRYIKLRLKIQELTAHLDARTGGYFSKKVRAARISALKTGEPRQ